MQKIIVAMAPAIFSMLTLCLVPSNATAQTSDRDQAALRVLKETMDIVCPEPDKKGKSQTIELDVAAQAGLSKLIKKLAELGFEGAIRYNNKEWEGVLQNELGQRLKDTSNCRLTVFNDLKIRLLGTQLQSKDGLIIEQAQPSQRIGSFLITLLRTELSGNTLTATFRVINDSPGKSSITLFGEGGMQGYGGTKLYAANKEYKASSIRVGDEEKKTMIGRKFPAGIPLDGRIVFHNVPPQTGYVDLLLAYSYNHLTPKGTVDFRKIAIN